MLKTAEQTVRYERIRRILLLILALNWGVAVAKILYGLVSHFNSMVADGFHSLSDGLSNVIGIIGITIASQPADKDHPYGHKKFETLFSFAITALLLLLCFNLLKEGVTHFNAPRTPRIDGMTAAVMLITLAVNIFVMTYERRQGEKLQSDILIADALHTRADIATSLSVIIASVVIRLGYPILDAVTTIIIALFIGYTALSIFKQGAGILVDSAAIDTKRLIAIVLSVPGAQSCHKVRTRGRADDIYIDLHVQVDPVMPIQKAHAISYQIEDAIKQKIPGVSDVVVHMEPLERP